ncbi:MAG: hypothetical protein LBH40_05610 [Alphaproteobacteria bacterium]|jgi:hypothetical protein|nr:hypothetical protein [Alphaproteobacteria bacterium]
MIIKPNEEQKETIVVSELKYTDYYDNLSEDNCGKADGYGCGRKDDSVIPKLK